MRQQHRCHPLRLDLNREGLKIKPALKHTAAHTRCSGEIFSSRSCTKTPPNHPSNCVALSSLAKKTTASLRTLMILYYFPGSSLSNHYFSVKIAHYLFIRTRLSLDDGAWDNELLLRLAD